MKTESTLGPGLPRFGQTRSTCLAAMGALLMALSSAWTTHAQAPSVGTDHTVYLPGEEIVATFKDGPGHPTDWVGIYSEGQTPGGPGSTRWSYVNNTQTAGEGLTEGQITFPGGLSVAGNWVIYFLINDGYTKIATNTFTVVDPSAPLLRTDKRTYSPGDPITANFSNGPANPKDWIGLYKAGTIPGGGGSSTLYLYVDGTAAGTTGKSDGAVTFAAGLPTVGSYVAYLLENDGYTVLASDPFTVAEPSSTSPRVLSVYPRDGASGLPPVWDFVAFITNGVTQVVPGSVALTLDGTTVTHQYTEQAGLVKIAYTNDTLLPSGSSHTYQLLFKDNGQPATTTTKQGSFTAAAYQNIVLPAPVVFEGFDSTPEGQFPAGWTLTNYTDVSTSDSTIDFGNLDSAAFEGWTVVNADRFASSFVIYSNPDRTTLDYTVVMAVNPSNVVNGTFVRHLATGQLAFADSGYRNGRGQVMYLFSPDFDLSGKSNIFLSYHSLWHQNQNSMGAVEYSIDQGSHWLPIVYMLDDQNQNADVIRFSNGTIDAVTTMTTVYGDLPLFSNPDTGEDMGGYYGAYIGAPISQDLAPFISGRVNDDGVESKRVELFRLAHADSQAKVRFRFSNIGRDSWYFGIDDFGLYSIATAEPPAIVVSPKDATVTAGDDANFSVQASGTPPLRYQWAHNDQDLSSETNAILSLSSVKTTDAGRYAVRVTNSAGTASAGALLTVNPRPTAVSGVWRFEQGNLAVSAGVGQLNYADGASTEGITTFETTDGTSTPHIGGKPVKFMRVPAFTESTHGYTLTMPTVPNGGGGYLNRYTMVFDLLIPGSLGWTALFNTNPGNANDADFYATDTGALGIGDLGYSGAGAIAQDTWYRIAFTADLGSGNANYYVNGARVHARTGGSMLDGRFSLSTGQDAGPQVLLFNEPSGSYTHELLLHSFMFTDRRMSPDEVSALGGPQSDGIPLDSSGPVTLKAGLSGTTLTFTWAGGGGSYQLQKSTTLTEPSWQNVGTATTATSATDTLTGVSGFYRLLVQ